MKKRRRLKKSFAIIFCALILGSTIFASATFCFDAVNANEEIRIEKYDVLSYNSKASDDVVYLSDIPYMKAQIGWKTIGLDKTNDNANLVMRIDNSSVVVKKGIWAHATSTVEYDISAYKDYTYFTTYYGLNTSAGSNGNGVKFYIYTSKDGKEWTLRTEENPTALKGTNNAVRVKIDIRDANYIRLYAHDNGSNASDHAVWGDAKLVKEGYSDNVMKPVEEFDEIIKANYQSGPIPEELRLVLLQRNFIKNVGQYQLRSFLEADSKNYETLNWFINNEEALRLWTIGGKPSGTYQKSLQVLSDLYHAHKADLSNENVTVSGTGIKYKDLYLKMMLSLSLTHAGSVGLWTDIRQQSNALNRYEIYKEMHLNGLLASNAMFESYTIDEMRGVMANNIDDEEILWLHDYSKKYSSQGQVGDRFNPYKYIKYTLGYGYYRPKYYSQENYAMWDKKYNLSKYNVPYQSGKPKLWIVFEEGAVCGGLSKTAANLQGVWGYPARVVGQPGHAAYVYLYNAGGGKYAWQLSNSVSTTGWTNTTGGGYNGWGSRYSFNNNTISTGSYLLLSQDAQNEYEKYEQSQLIMLLEDVYKNDRKKLEKIYRDALKEEIINLDAWIGLVNLYITDTEKTEAELVGLAEEIASVYTYYPLPMYDLTRRIGTKVASAEYRSKLMMIQDETLRKATKATDKDTLYYKEVPVIANALLGVVDNRIATFSFDGANAGKIVLSKQLQSAQVAWTYSLDGGKTWKDCFEHSAQLTQEEINSINTTNDIKIHITGLPMTDANIYTIDITKASKPSGVTINDFEDRMYGTNSSMEWTLDPNGEWTSFANSNPLFSGNKKVYVRTIANGTNIASDSVYFTFTDNVGQEEKRYIPSRFLSVPMVSSTQQGNMNNIVDGNPKTYWRSKRNSGFNPKYIKAWVVIELNEPRFVTALDYIHDSSSIDNTFSNQSIRYGYAKNVTIEVSMDGTNWTKVASKTLANNNDSAQQIVFDEAFQAKYVRFTADTVYDTILSTSLTIGEIYLYEDTTQDPTPRAEVNYNITNKTNKNVVAELVNPTRSITVTNNDGKMTHTFDKNGDFTFEFVDKAGNKGTATAHVDWIDKKAPTAQVQFSTTELTNENVVATLSFDKNNITILSTDVDLATNPVDGSKTLTFLENGTFELKFADELGNVGTKTITVDWIDTEAPTAEFEFNTVHLTEGEVIATLKPSEEVTITNNNGSDTYTFTKNGEFTFEFVDRAGNAGEATVTVDWISKPPKYEIKYSTESLTNQNVKVTLELENGYRIFNNNASNEYVFENNGTFDFQYKDENGYDGLIPVTVDWIDKEDPTAEFEFSTRKWTNQNVVVTLKPSEEVTVKNNGGKKSYTFTKNGSFTFEFVDRAGNSGEATVRVDWIDKTKPTATIEYSTTDKTEGPVVATLKPSEEVTVKNNSGKLSYTFRENAEFTFEFVDRAGNVGYATAKVTWIEKKQAENPDVKPDDKPTNKPTNSNTNGNTKPGENTGTKPNDKPTIPEETYKNMSSGNVTVKVPNSILSKYEDATLDYQKLTLSDAQKNRYGKDSEIYRVTLETKDNKEINLSTTKLTQTVKLDSNKEFDAIYVVRDDGSVVKLDSKVTNNEVEFEDSGLGKYIIAYKTDSEEKPNTNTNSNNTNVIENKDTENSVNYLPYIIGGVAILLVGGVIYFVVRKKKDN